ncbi:MAG: FRG domain-containing protein [Erysipelotrichaceae bacterium]|nr:FRG domain-containing protein [Erysipelotrichaceae bacterium]
MKDVVIHNWEELQEIIFQGVWDEKLMRYRSNFVYRGVCDKSYGLVPKLNWVCSHCLELEKSLLRNFRKYAYADLGNYNSFWQMLSLAQHHGLPTRLLDWSYSPLVAAHFATEDISEYDKDGVIWCVNFVKLNQQLPKVLKDELSKQNSNSFTIDMLEKHAGDFDKLKSLSENPFVLFFEPASMLDRIANQYALFSVVSDAGTLMNDLIPDDESVCFRIIIPKEVKLEIRDKLDYINISERLIYPGLDGICKWITRRYSNLGPIYNKNHKR